MNLELLELCFFLGFRISSHRQIQKSFLTQPSSCHKGAHLSSASPYIEKILRDLEICILSSLRVIYSNLQSMSQRLKSVTVTQPGDHSAA